MNLSLIVCIVGAIVYLIPFSLERDVDLNELGKWAFVIGLAAYLFGK